MKIFDETKPLWLPEGSVRALLSISIIGGYSILCVMKNNYEALGLLAVIIAKDYFESRKPDT